jgi:hypothetical protein
MSLFRGRLGLASLVLTLAIAAGAAAVLWQTTRWGIGLRGDSLAYIGGARNLLAGEGYTRTTGSGQHVPITHFPPFYAVSLAATGRLLGLDPFPAARYLHAALFALGALLTGLAFAAMGQGPLLAPLGALLFATDDVLFEAFAWNMAEAPFLILLLASLLVTAAYLERRFLWILVIASVLIVLATLTRYAGLPLLPAVLVALLTVYIGRRQDRISLTLFLGITLIPILLLALANSLLAGSPVNRGLAWHPPSIGELRLAVRAVWEWALPAKLLAGQDPELPPYVQAFLLILASIAALIGLLLVRARGAASQAFGLSFLHSLSLSAALYIVIYAGLLLVNLSLIDASTPLDHRILSPIYLCLLLLIGAGFALLSRSRFRLVRWLSLPLALALILTSVDDMIDTVRQIYAGGLGFSSADWATSPTVQAVVDLPQTPIYTDQPDVVYLLTGRSAFIVFARTDPVTGLPRPDYDAWTATVRRNMCERDARLVLFHPDLLVLNPADREMVESLTEGMQPEQSYEDGVIYRCQGPAEE